MRFVHISDLHLGKTFPVSRYGQLAARRRQELLDAFSRLVDYVNENQVDFILCSGDFLNSEELRVEELRNINEEYILNRTKDIAKLEAEGNQPSSKPKRQSAKKRSSKPRYSNKSITDSIWG